MTRTPDEPLTMTVHTLPQPGEVVASDAARTRAGRWKMLMLLLVCAAPVIASYFTYYVIRPEGRSSYGELIDPQRPLPAIEGRNAAGEPVSLPSLRNQWLLISVADSACDEACERHLYLQRQIREMLGREKDRLDWVWLRTGDAPLREPLAQATAAAVVLHVDEQEVSRWLEPAPGRQLQDHLYVVDPLGNWMMRFPAEVDPKRARRDMDRLLRASAFWDRAGR
ncbi:MAG: hypothetical protein EP306_05515 [Burkholderiales bacterium]|nr:MAG: hypothetical protein EP306_05515 [Burkholderiales bacterium]